MKDCLTVFNIDKKPESSELLKSLESQYPKDTAKMMYDNIIWSDVYQTDSFLQWLDSKDDFLRTSTNEPHIDEFNSWLLYINKKSRVNKTFKTNKLETSVQEFIDISDGLTAIITDVLDDKKLTFNDLYENSSAQSKNILNNALGEVIQRMEDTASEAEDPYFAERITDIINEIKGNKWLFFESYNNYLESTLKLNVVNNMNDNVDEIENENDDARVTRDNAFDRNSIEFDQKETAPKAIKLMIASLKQIDNEGYEILNDLGLPKIVDYNSTFNFIQQKLVDIPADIELYVGELQKYTDKKPEFKLLLNRINFNKPTFHFSTDEMEAFKENQLRTQFVNQFDKTKYTYTLHIKDEDGNMKVIDSNLDKAQNIKLTEWENNFKLLISENSDKYSKENFEKNIKDANKIELLEALGIDSVNPNQLPDYVISEIQRYGLKTYEDFLTIYQRKRENDVRARLLKLAELETLMDNSTVELQHYNAEGKLVYDISLNTYLSKVVKNLGYYAGNEDMLNQKFPELFNNPYSANSEILGRVRNGNVIKIGISTGLKNDSKDSSKPTDVLNRKDITVQKLYSLLQEGQYNFFRAADRSVENIIYFEGLRGRQGLMVDGKLDAVSYLINHFFDEVQAIQYYKLGTGVVNLDSNFSSRALIMKDGTNIMDMMDFDTLSDMSVDDMMEDSTIINFVKNKVDEIVETEKQYLSKYNVGASEMQGLLKEYGSIDKVIEQYALNSFVGNIEFTKVFTGDPQIYGKPSNFFKRMSMLNSTKESTRTDNEINSFLSGITNNLETKYGYTEGRTDSSIKTITINDIESSIDEFSEDEVNTLKEILGTTKGYKGINEADGFAYITYDEYRIMKIRYAEWNTLDEKLYQKLTSIKEGEEITIDESDYHMIMPDKSQFVGKLMNTDSQDFNIVAGRKFSFLPLIPGLYRKGSVLDKLNQQMLSNGVGMAFMTSAAKFGHSANEKNNAHHNIYDKDGNFSLEITGDNHDILDYSYMGNQLRISKIEKTKQIESTQKRKLNLSNFFENGKFIGEEGPLSELIKEYDLIQREKLKRSYDTLKTKLGLTEELDTSNPDQLQDFVDSLVEMGTLQGFTTNELQALENLSELPFLDILPNKQKVENFIMAKLKNKTISQKRKGTALAQSSNVGFEIDGENRHDLKFYRLSKDKTRLLPMEVSSPLPKSLMKYVSNNYNDGAGLTESALEEFNRDIEMDNKIFEETGKMTDLTRITMMVGFRIPNQGPSSSDVAKVKRFYMPHIGGSIIVPKAIVAKTGSDFDIDKLNLYFPEFNVTGDADYKIANKFIKDNLSRAQITKYLKAEEIGSDYNKLSMKELNELFRENILEGNIDDIKNVLLKEYKRRYINMLEGKKQTIRYVSPEGNISELSGKALSNRTLENEIGITLSKENWKQLLTPLDSNTLFNKEDKNNTSESIVNILRKLTGHSSKENMSQIFEGNYNTDKMIEFLSGKAGVGQTAVHNTNHILAQLADLKMVSLHDYFNITKDGNIDLGIIRNEDGQLISELLSELLTAYVDIAKDPYILDINAVTQTANTIFMMVRQGISLKKIFFLMNQPIVKSYIDLQSLNESLSIDEFSSKDSNVKKTLTQYGIGTQLHEMIYYTEEAIEEGNLEVTSRKGKIYEDFTLTELSEGIKSKGKDKNVQLKALDIYLEMQRQSKHFQEMIRSTSPDTQQFKSFTLLEKQVNLRDKVRENGLFINYDKMFDNFIGSFWDVKKDYKDKTSQFFLAQLPSYKVELDNLKDFIGDVVRNQETAEKQMLKIENDFIYFLLNENGTIKNELYFRNLFTGEKSVPKLIKKLKDLYVSNEEPNKFLEAVLPLINETGEGFDNAKSKDKKLTSIQKEQIYVDFADLKNYDEYFKNFLNLKGGGSIYNRMITYFMMQSGINNSPYNLVNFIPSKDYMNFVKDSIESAKNGTVDITKFTSIFDDNIGLYALNNLSLFYKKDKKLPFTVIFHKSNKKFSISLSGLHLWQKGNGIRSLDYSNILQKVSGPTMEEEYNIDDNNPLNCQNNKR